MADHRSGKRNGTGGPLLDPRGRVEVEEKTLAPRPGLVEGTTVGLLDNAESNASRFPEVVGEILAEEYG